MEKISPKFAVANPDDEIFFGESERTQDINAKRYQLNVGREILLADDVAIELKMFAQAAALLLFVSEELSDREPFERFLEFPFVRCNHTSERRRELGTQCDFAFAFVSEIKKLLDDFRAAFLFVELGRLERRALPFDEAVAAGHLTPASENVIAPGAILG